MKRSFKNTAGYTPVKRVIRGSAPSVANRYMRLIPRLGPSTPAAGPSAELPSPAQRQVPATRRRGVTAQQQREANDQRDRDLMTADSLELQADRLTAARLNGRVPQAEIDAAGDLAEEYRRQAWALKESHGYKRPAVHSTAEIDRYFVTCDPWATTAELEYLFDDGSPRITMQARLVTEQRTQARLAAAARLG